MRGRGARARREPCWRARRQPVFDLIVRGGTVFDGTGAAAQRADIGISGDRIVAVGDLPVSPRAATIDASGLSVAPGFIDVQGQSGTTLLADGNGESHLRQGITSEIIGEGGSPAFWTAGVGRRRRAQAAWDHRRLDRLRRLFPTGCSERGIAINLGTLVPATMVRERNIGLDESRSIGGRARRGWKPWSTRRCATARSVCPAR